MSKKYKVVYTGELQENAELTKVRTLFSETFKVSKEKTERFLQPGKPKVTKTNLPHETALKLGNKLNDIGLKARIIEIKDTKATEAQPEPVKVGPPKVAPAQPQPPSVDLSAEVQFAKSWIIHFILGILVAGAAGLVVGLILGVIAGAIGLPRGTITLVSQAAGLLLGLASSFYFYRWSINKYIIPQLS